MTNLPPIRTVLRYGRGVVNSIPVQLVVRLTAVGTLELWCQATESEHRWQLQFDVRQTADAPTQPGRIEDTVDQTTIAPAQEEIRRTFGSRDPSGEHTPDTLRKNLEAALGMSRERWPTGVLRQLADALLDHSLRGA